ncbi:MAG TPA: hypothetical protein VK472_06685 [Allosphingosinicella sp.]|nr:hypothetical protein [Allosphingosinicella sp.]
MKQNQNALVPAGAEYDSATGTFIVPAPSASTGEIAPFDPVAFRPRFDGWTPERQRAFIEELADCGQIGEAAARVGMSRKSAWQLRLRAGEGSAFAMAFEAALEAGVGRLRAIAFERAVEGVAKPVYYRGEKVGEQRVYDNRLLLALIGKAPRPPAARRSWQVHQDWKRWLDAIGQGRADPAAPIEAAGDEDGGSGDAALGTVFRLEK